MRLAVWRVRGAALPLLLVLCLLLSGCQSTEEKEHAEVVAIAREHTEEREKAHGRALRIEALLRPALERQPERDGCRFAVREPRTREGIALVACGDFGGSWPLPVSWGYLRCEPAFKNRRYRLIFSTPRGTEYALNWRARGVGYPNIKTALRREDGGRIDVGALVERARTLCGST